MNDIAKPVCRVDVALRCPIQGGDWVEIYEVRSVRGNRLVCTCETMGAARRVCRALNLGHAYGRGVKSNGRREITRRRTTR